MPRFLPLHSPLSFTVKDCEVTGCLLSPVAKTTVGVIARDWSDWLSALAFVPLVPTWVWILDCKWERVARTVLPNAAFINGFTSSLPPVDILLLSGVTLLNCSISLKNCPSSLILSTSRLKVAFGWISRFWKLPHRMTGGCTDGVWKVYSLHRASFVSPPCLFTSPSLPAGSLRRVLNTSASGGCNISLPSADRVRLLDDVCKLNHLKSLFSVPSVFYPSGWRSRRLSFPECSNYGISHRLFIVLCL